MTILKQIVIKQITIPLLYEAAPGDEKGPKKKSKWTEKVEKRYGKMKNEETVPAAFEDLDYLMAEDLLYEDMDTALANKAKQTGYPISLMIGKEVMSFTN